MNTMSARDSTPYSQYTPLIPPQLGIHLLNNVHTNTLLLCSTTKPITTTHMQLMHQFKTSPILPHARTHTPSPSPQTIHHTISITSLHFPLLPQPPQHTPPPSPTPHHSLTLPSLPSLILPPPLLLLHNPLFFPDFGCPFFIAFPSLHFLLRHLVLRSAGSG
jgi:hypothetical protein